MKRKPQKDCWKANKSDAAKLKDENRRRRDEEKTIFVVAEILPKLVSRN